VMPDDTAIAEWYYVFLNRFVREDAAPDLVVVSVAYNTQVADRKVDGARLGALFCDLGNRSELLSCDLRTVGDRVDFLVGRAFHSVGVRERLQARVGDLVVPAYRSVTRELNERSRRRNLATSGGRPAPPASYRTLQRFLRLCRRCGTTAVVVVLPLPALQAVDAALEGLVRSEGMVFVDARSAVGLQPGDFSDGYHLDRGGATAYTAWLARRLATLAARGVPGGLSGAGRSQAGTGQAESGRGLPSGGEPPPGSRPAV
jgi:hypothetical protein